MAKRKKKSTELDYWLASGSLPMFVVDAHRRIRSFNEACQALTGWTAAEVIGATTSYSSPTDSDQPAVWAASLSPPPEAFSGSEVLATLHVLHRDGRRMPRHIQFLPLYDDEQRVVAVLGIISEFHLTPPRDESPARQLHAELSALKSTLRTRFGMKSFVAQSPVMQRVLTQCELAQATSSGVLLTGPQGVGKEHLARAIHLGSALKTHAFVPLDCRRLPHDELQRVWNQIEEEQQGASNPLVSSGPRPGTLYFAEVEWLPRDLQQQIANSPVVAHRAIRLMAGSVCELTSLENNDRILPQFLALLSPLEIRLPELARRTADISILSQHFLEEQNRIDSKQVGGFDEAVWPLLTRYTWPENLDELAGVVADAHAHATGNFILPDDLPHRFHGALAAQESPPVAATTVLSLDAILEKTESRLIEIALERSRNNKSRAADFLGINRARLLRRIVQLGLGTGEPAETDDSE